MNSVVRGLVSCLVALFAGFTLGPLLIADPTGLRATAASVGSSAVLAILLYHHLRTDETRGTR